VADLQVTAPHATVPEPPLLDPLLDPLPDPLLDPLPDPLLDPPLPALASFSEPGVGPASDSWLPSGSSSDGSSSRVRPPHAIAPAARTRTNRPVEVVARMNVSPKLHVM
jgi:hypothetical protein